MLHHTSKFLIIASNPNNSTLNGITLHLTQCGVYNYATIFESNNLIYIKVDDIIKKTAKFINRLDAFSNKNISKLIFPDRTRNAHFNIIAALGNPYFFKKDNKPYSKYSYMLDVFSKYFMSLCKLEIIPDLSEVQKIINERRKRRQYDLSLINIVAQGSIPKLLTYEQEAFCILVPKIPTISLVLDEFFLSRPFEGKIWFLWILSLILAGLCWKFLRRSDDSSFWKFIYSNIVMLFGQNLQLKSGRRILKLLFQIFIFSNFILNNIYEGIVTSSMIVQTGFYKFTTFSELLESKIEFKFFSSSSIGKIFDEMKIPKYDHVRERFVIGDRSSHQLLEMARKNIVIITTCSNADMLIRANSNESILPYYYFLPEKLMNQFQMLDVGLNSQYVEKWQEVLDFAFAGGLVNKWKELHASFVNISMKQPNAIEPDTILSFKEIFPFAVKILFFHMMAFLIFLLEIFCHDFLSNLSWKYIHREIHSQKKKVMRPKVRRIQVKPIII